MLRAAAMILPALLAVANSADASPKRLQWDEDWPKFRPSEWVFTLAFAPIAPLMAYAVPEPPPGFLGNNALDDGFRDVFRIRSESGRDVAILASDFLQNSLILYPFVVDAGLVAGLLDNNWELALQMSLMGAEAFAIQAAIVVMMKRTIGRVRPSIQRCEDGTFSCRSRSRRRAFPSGHAAASFAGAGLACVQHQFLPLYGSKTWDGFACGTMVTLATTAALLRVVSDEHHFTDVLASSAIGFVSGYLVPYLLHFWRPPPEEAPLNGMLHVGALSGPAHAGDRLQAAFGMVVSGRQLLRWAPDWGGSIEAEGLMFGTRGRYFFRELRAGLRLWGHHIGLGPEVSYHSEVGPDRTALQAGATLAFAIFEQKTTIVASASWLPLADGSLDHFDGALEVSFLRYPTVTARVRRVATGAAFLLSAGGRLPW